MNGEVGKLMRSILIGIVTILIAITAPLLLTADNESIHSGTVFACGGGSGGSGGGGHGGSGGYGTSAETGVFGKGTVNTKLARVQLREEEHIRDRERDRDQLSM